MVSKKHILGRLAFSMIELIFAIVIIGVTVLSLPMLTQITSKGIEESLVQEAIFAASAEINQATSFYWDRNSMDVDNNNSLAQVINLNSECNATTKLRVGHINQIYHRRCLDNTDINVTANSFNLNVPNLNNAVKTNVATFSDDGTSFTASKHGYKEAYRTTITVSSAAFGGLSNDGNIKQIEVTIRDSDNVIATRLRSYSANIGEIDYYKRTF